MKAPSLIPFLTAVNVITLLLQLAGMGTLGSFHYFPMLNLAVPLICLFNFLFFFFWLFRMRWQTVLFFVALLLGINEWGMLYRFPNADGKDLNGIKVLSFNVRLFNRLQWIKREDIPESIEKFINAEGPDVICFQEFDKAHAPKLSQYPYRFFAPNKRTGSAIYSRKPLFNKQTIQFENSTNSGVYADLIYQADTLRIFNIHFESLRFDLVDSLHLDAYATRFRKRLRKVQKLQLAQVQSLNELISDDIPPSVLCTDLNNTAFSSVYDALPPMFQDAYLSHGSGLGGTYSLFYFPLRIDFIFVDARLKVNSFKTHAVMYSDHQPLTAHIGLR